MTQEEKDLEIAEIKQWLNDNDYKVIKWVMGEYQNDLSPFDAYVIERTTKKARLKELQGE